MNSIIIYGELHLLIVLNALAILEYHELSPVTPPPLPESLPCLTYPLQHPVIESEGRPWRRKLEDRPIKRYTWWALGLFIGEGVEELYVKGRSQCFKGRLED